MGFYLCYVGWGLPIEDYPAIYAHLKRFEGEIDAAFAFDTGSFFHNDALYMIAGVNEYVVAILNSSISWWFLRQICTDLQNGYLQAFRENLYQIRESFDNAKQQSTIIKLVDRIFDAKYADPNAHASNLANEINQVVYSLYNLAPEEIGIVEEAAIV